MPQKKKKTAQSKEVQDLQISIIELATMWWPGHSITMATLANPTQEFVLQFYQRCVDELTDIVATASRSAFLPEPPGLSKEEALFFRLSKIPVLMEQDFKLSDLYEFNPDRVSFFIYVLSHFMVFTKQIRPEMINNCDRLFDAKSELVQAQKNMEEFKEKKFQKQLELTNLRLTNADLKEEASLLLPKYNEVMEMIEKSEEKCKSKLLEIETLKKELKNIEEEIQKLEETEQVSRSQILSESEHNMLMSKLDTLKLEESNLDEVHAQWTKNILMEQKQNIQKLRMCITELDKLKLGEYIYQLSGFRVQLHEYQQRLQHCVDVFNVKELEVQTVQNQIEKEKAIQEEEKQTLKMLQKLAEQGMLKEMDLNKKCKEATQDSPDLNERRRILKMICEEHERVQADIEEKLNLIFNIQQEATKRLKNFVSEINVIRNKCE